MMITRNWVNYFFSTDFTEAAESLRSIETDTVLEADTALGMAALLQEVDRGEGQKHWVGEGSVREWNLKGAHVCYNGPNDPSLPTNSKYSHVLMILFPDTSQKPVGKLCLQYNLKEV